MTQKINEITLQPSGYYQVRRSGDNSPRIDGVLKLQSNSFEYQKGYGSYQKWHTSSYNPYSIYGEHFSDQGYRQGILAPRDGIYPLEKFHKESVLNSLKVQLLGELHDMDINLAVAYAERTATANLVKGTATKLLKGARAIKKGNFNEAARHLGLPHSGLRKDHQGRWRRTNYTRDAFSQKWLEFSYGWVPLYNDMYGSLVAADKALAKTPDRLIPVKKQAHYEETTKDNTTVVDYYGPKTQVAETIHVKQVMKMACNVKIENPALATVQSVGLTNPALVAWELIPYSFVIDWVLPIGDWLTAITPLIGITPVDVFSTVFSEEHYELGEAHNQESWPVFVWNPNTERYEWHTATSTAKYFAGSSHRIVVSRERSDLSVSFPKPQFPGAWQQAASAVALFHQFMSKAGRF